jgi:4-hydroxybenzoate polyprenyltransferase
MRTLNATTAASISMSDKASEQSIKACLPDLVSMTRPSNLPVVVLLHMLGTFLVIKETGITYWSLFFSPGMMMTLVALLLTSATSMLVNDYYDYKLGHDTTKIYKPLPSNRITLPTVKKFLTSLYAISLMCVTVLPGVPARATVTMGLILTFWYTKHLKPKTWLKNAVCASLIALSPLTSGLAALGISESYSWSGVAPLLRVVSTLFVGILGREITMDINDVEDDINHGIQTVPAVYGRKFASAIGVACSFGVACLTMSAPLWKVVKGRTNIPVMRQLVLSSLGSFAQLWRSWQVYKTEGMDRDVNDQAVREGLLSVALILASFV